MTDPHLDDEQLSLLLDDLAAGDAAAASRAHLDVDGCAVCGDRLAALRAARDLVAGAAVPPLADGVLDRLVATALAAGDGAPVVPLSAARRARARRTAPPAWLAGVAAGIAALAGVVGLLRATSDGGDSMAAVQNQVPAQEGAAKGVADDATTEALTGGVDAAAAVDPELVTADLADQDDPAALALVLGGVGNLTATPTASAFQARRQAAGGSAASGAAADAGTEADEAAPTTTTAAAPPPAAVDRAQCRAAAEAAGAGRLGPLLSTATLRWRGQPAEVLVYRLAQPATEGDATLTRQAFVLSRPGCSLLADPRF